MLMLNSFNGIELCNLLLIGTVSKVIDVAPWAS